MQHEYNLRSDEILIVQLVLDDFTVALGGSDVLKFWAGKCIYRETRRDFPTLLIPTSDIFYAQNFAQILAIFKAFQLQ